MKTKALILSGALCLAQAARADEVKVEKKPLSIGALQEFGQIGRGLFNAGNTSQNSEILTSEWLDHFGAFVTQQAIVNDRLLLSGGVGGVFQFRKPEIQSPGFTGSERKEFFVGPTDAEAVYSFGDVKKPWLQIGAGLFPFKYNPDAVNMGEYLFRSGAYPGYTVTGGYVINGSAAAYLEGFKSALDFGALKLNLLLTTETGIAPLYDWSPAILASYTVKDGLLEIGAGVNFKRLISVAPSKTARHLDANGYFTVGDKSYTTNRTYYNEEISFYNNKHTAIDSARTAPFKADSAVVRNVMNMADGDPAKPQINYYTSAGTLLMGRIAIDPKKVIGVGLFGPQDLKLYAEVAVLGVKDYPVFYDNIMHRIPVMFGFNFPAFRFLDLVSIQLELYKSPWLNNTATIGGYAIATPFTPSSGDSLLSRTDYNDLAQHDDFKWSVVVQKKLGNYITLSGQVANDHLHLVNSNYYYGPNFDHNEITVEPADFYWTAQISWGL